MLTFSYILKTVCFVQRDPADVTAVTSGFVKPSRCFALRFKRDWWEAQTVVVLFIHSLGGRILVNLIWIKFAFPHLTGWNFFHHCQYWFMLFSGKTNSITHSFCTTCIRIYNHNSGLLYTCASFCYFFNYYYSAFCLEGWYKPGTERREAPGEFLRTG